MTDPGVGGTGQLPAGDAGAPADEAVRRRVDRDRQRRRVFGDVLDGSTLDDRPDPATSPGGDRWLEENVPPHHGE